MTGTERLSIIAMATLLAGCGGGSRWTGTITDSAGVAIVANTNQGVWSPSEGWTLEEDLRIGMVEGDPTYQFGQIGFIAVDSRGEIYVTDLQTQNIRVFSPQGEHLRTIGRPGAGPGELSPGAAFVLIAPGDTLLVPDLQNRRVNRYLADGTSLGSFPVALERGLPAAFRVTAARAIVMQLRPLALPNMPAPDTMDAIVVIEPSGEIRDTIMKFPSGRTLNLGGAAPEINVFAAEPLWDVTQDLGVLYGVNNAYRISRYGQDGSLERVITMPHEPEPVTESDQRVIMQFLERQARDAGAPPEAMQQLRAMIKFGEFIPAFSAILTGPDNTIWVQHQRSLADATEEEIAEFNLIEESGAPDWDIFDDQGRYLGIVTMPPRFQPRSFDGDNMYGVWRDDLDVQYVMRLRIMTE